MKKILVYLCILLTIASNSFAWQGLRGQPVVYNAVITGLRISAVDGTAFLDNLDVTVQAPTSFELVDSGTVTRDNMRISAVAGTAFVDFSAGTDLTDNLGKYLVVTDSTGKTIKGWLGAVGTDPETLGADVIVNGDFASAAGWTEGAGWEISGGVLTGIDVTGLTYRPSAAITVGMLHVLVFDIVSRTAGSVRVTGGGDGTTSAQNVSAIATHSRSWTRVGTDSSFYLAGSAFSGVVDNFSVKQVLTPSATGATIVSTKAGTTFSWESQETGFNYNDASGYSYEIYNRDLSALADGEHMIEVFDATGKFLRGWLGAVGSDPETLGADVLAGWNFTSGWGKAIGTETIIDADSFSTTGVGGIVNEVSPTLLVGGLYKMTVAAPVNCVPILGTTPTRVSFVPNSTSYGCHRDSNQVYLRNSTAGTTDVTVLELYQVLTPSSTGATIVSAKSGATQNFTHRATGFNYNAASYRVIIKKPR